MKEHHTGEVIHAIDGLLNEFEVAGASDRFYKVNAFVALSDFQTQLGNNSLQCERIDSEFSGAMSHIVDWFFYNYLSMVEEITEDVTVNNDEIQQYLSDVFADINKYSDFFETTGDKQTVDRAHRAELFADLYDKHVVFIYDDFISLRFDENEARVEELAGLKSLINDENIIDTERSAVLYGMIDSFIEQYKEADFTAAAQHEINNILNKFDSELSLQIEWFEEHYSSRIDEIADTDRKDEYDEATVSNQIGELERIKQFIGDDGVVGTEYLLVKNEQIDQLLEEYESELASIMERIEQRNKEAAAAAAASRRNSETTASSSNSRTGTNSSNTSGNNSNSASRGTQTQSSGGSASAAGTSSRELLARLVKLEAPNECADGKQAVAEVVLNRMRSSRWNHANTVEEVIFDTRWGVQFTVKDILMTDRGNPTSADYAAADRALGGSSVLGRDYMFFATSPRTQNDVIWIGNHAFSK